MRREHQARVELLTPVVKGWCTETSINVTSTGIQVHGGMGFIEETGAAQHFRDARITTIYEGTTAMGHDRPQSGAPKAGSSLAVLLADIDATREQLLASGNAQLSAIGAALARGAGRWPKPATGCWRTTPASRANCRRRGGLLADWRGGRRLDDGARRASRWRQRP